MDRKLAIPVQPLQTVKRLLCKQISAYLPSTISRRDAHYSIEYSSCCSALEMLSSRWIGLQCRKLALRTLCTLDPEKCTDSTRPLDINAPGL
ncbi:hypothetical protein LSAT2_008832 [Lamellibrachia satsuma]|nr:hypothetical protein LSAT2_008832 [Lamellibrachia satsuma]